MTNDNDNNRGAAEVERLILMAAAEIAEAGSKLNCPELDGAAKHLTAAARALRDMFTPRVLLPEVSEPVAT